MDEGESERRRKNAKRNAKLGRLPPTGTHAPPAEAHSHTPHCCTIKQHRYIVMAQSFSIRYMHIIRIQNVQIS